MWWFLNERTVFQEQILIYIFWKQCSFNTLFPGRFCAVTRVCTKAAALSLGLSQGGNNSTRAAFGRKECLIKNKNALKEENPNQSVCNLIWAIAGKHQGKWWWLFVLSWGLGQALSSSSSLPHTKCALVMASFIYITCRSAHLAWGEKKIHNQVPQTT